MDLPPEEKYIKDIKIIREELKPVMMSLEEKEVNLFSVTLFFSTYVKEMLKDIGDKRVKDIIIRNMLD